MAKKYDFGFAIGMRSEQSNEQPTEQLEEVDHPGEATAAPVPARMSFSVDAMGQATRR
jgi:hypothetical protein